MHVYTDMYAHTDTQMHMPICVHAHTHKTALQSKIFKIQEMYVLPS